MQFFVSDLVFPAFNKPELGKLPAGYGLEIFTEFGTESYWQNLLPRLGVPLGKAETAGTGRLLTVHGPCVSVNLADPADSLYRRSYADTFRLAARLGARHVVVHTNEGLAPDQRAGGKALQAAQSLVRSRLRELEGLAAEARQQAGTGALPQLVIENVGLRRNMLFNEQEYVELIRSFPDCAALLDLGHAHVNGWDMCRVIAALGDRLVSFHIHDNDGSGDTHQPVGRGTIPWGPVLAAMKQCTPGADWVFEYANGTFADAADLADHLAGVRGRIGR